MSSGIAMIKHWLFENVNDDYINMWQGIYLLFYYSDELTVAVSFYPRSWIDVFALPQKINTESALDHDVRKISITF